MPILSALMIICPVPQAGPSFDQIEALKHKAYRSLADYREAINIQVSGSGQSQTITLSQRIQGQKQRMAALVNGKKYMESGHTGTDGWAITHPSKQYKLWTGPNLNYRLKYVAPDYKKAPLGDFNFLFENGYNIRFTANPPFKVLSNGPSTLDGQPARKVVARATIEPGKRYVQVTQWFFPDKWILRRFEVEGKGKQAGVFRVHGIVTESNFAAKSTPGMFRMDPALVKGYTLVKN